METAPSFTPMYRYELADVLKISVSTLARKLKQKEVELPAGILSPRDQKRVFDALWYPDPEWKKLFESLDDEA